MAAKKKSASTKKEPELVVEDGQYYIVDGSKKIDVGRSRIYAERMLAEHK